MSEIRYFEDRDCKREVFPCVINSICPIEYEDAARLIAYLHMTEHEKNPSASIEEMMPVYLAPIGETEPTHAFCSRDGLCHQVRMLEKHIETLPYDWVYHEVVKDGGLNKSLLLYFSVIVGDTAEILKFFGLQEIKHK